ncbi:protein-export chaperone SecB [Pelagibius litoralis]|uniref:Protein-export protein SecB n=1 Tax=Pelagibius litoralis TaxID=374515 RepID=A0A967KG05_9PROT|nr:protein-export chaperone SecB [Pelagibius litoralis]NIA71715.1 protein-export chaperone SecB [Pelagibius litoralis]
MAEEAAQAPLTINSQYVKDHSFENPNAPGIYGSMRKESPQLNVNVEVTPGHLQGDLYEVTLGLRASAMIGETTAFLAELDYAAVVTIANNLDEKVREQMLMIEVPRFLFPFARAILADDTRDGGFPPLIMNPIDFGQMYMSRKMAQSAENPSGEGESGEDEAGEDGGEAAAEETTPANGQA